MASQIAVIRATLKYSTQAELIVGMKPLLSKRGLFIYTRTTRPVGSEVRFEFSLADGSQTYAGEGVVRKEVPFVGGPSSQKSGMLIALKRVNRPFKAVVDAILGEDEPESAVHKAPGKQFIVESRAGEPQGFDLFGDMDLDEGLDSLFSGIAKKPKEEKSGLYVAPTVVSGMFHAPENEIMLEYQSGDLSEVPAQQMTPGDQLGERMHAYRQTELMTRAVTGQYAAVTDIADAEREAEAYELRQSGINPVPQAISASQSVAEYEGSPTYEDAPTYNEMQAVWDSQVHDGAVAAYPGSTDDTVEMAPSIESRVEGEDEGSDNMFGDALDFNHSPVVERMEREFEFERGYEQRDETPVQMPCVSGMAVSESANDGNEANDVGNAERACPEPEPLMNGVESETGDAAYRIYGQPMDTASQPPCDSPLPYGIYGQPMDTVSQSPCDLPSTCEAEGHESECGMNQARDEVDSFERFSVDEDAMPVSSDSVEESHSVWDNGESRLDSTQTTEFQFQPPKMEFKQPPKMEFSTPQIQPLQSQIGASQEAFSTQESPSELFEALHADILGMPSGEMAAVDLSASAPSMSEASSAVSAHSEEKSIETQSLEAMFLSAAPETKVQEVTSAPSSSMPESLASLAPAASQSAPRRAAVSLDSLLSAPTNTGAMPTPRGARSSASSCGNAEDIINTDMTTAGHPVPRKRKQTEEMPTPKKGGFFSNLFKR